MNRYFTRTLGGFDDVPDGIVPHWVLSSSGPYPSSLFPSLPLHPPAWPAGRSRTVTSVLR